MPGTRRSSLLAGVAAAELQRVLSRRRRAGKTLLHKRARLAARIADLDTRIAELRLRASANGHSGGTRTRNEMSLSDALAKVLDGETMSNADAMKAVQKAGYRLTVANLCQVVSIALNISGKLKKVERGRYTAK